MHKHGAANSFWPCSYLQGGLCMRLVTWYIHVSVYMWVSGFVFTGFCFAGLWKIIQFLQFFQGHSTGFHHWKSCEGLLSLKYVLDCLIGINDGQILIFQTKDCSVEWCPASLSFYLCACLTINSSTIQKSKWLEILPNWKYYQIDNIALPFRQLYDLNLTSLPPGTFRGVGAPIMWVPPI